MTAYINFVAELFAAAMLTIFVLAVIALVIAIVRGWFR